MKKIFSWQNESTYTTPLSPACKMCKKGSKIVILITGLCSAKCFYCPLSARKLGKDRIFANEWELENEKDTEKLITEAEYIEATGAGITGGDPLIVWKRTKKYISILKDTFGPNFHIHLYTSGLKNNEHVKDLFSAGLDEIRYHPASENWSDMDNSPIVTSIKNALKIDIDVAVEIPVIPGMEDEIFSLIKWANEIGVKWVNLNELEYSETNAKILNDKGFAVKNDISAAVKGSQETAYNVINRISEMDYDIGVHYCSSSFKDATQLRNRIKRRAKNVARNYEVITDEGTLLKGVIYTKNMSLIKICNLLKKEFNIQNDQLFINKGKKRVELNILVLQKIATNLKKQNLECFIVEEYPTADGLEVERIPLPI
jgi:pyruvate formate-lyase activating enzyme-like uncharacterized protein